MTRTIAQRILRRVRKQLPFSCTRFTKVNDDSLGYTYLADGYFWVIVEMGWDDSIKESAIGNVDGLFYTVQHNYKPFNEEFVDG